MNSNLSITTVTDLPSSIDDLVIASERENYRFISRLKKEWLSRENHFSKAHECLMVAMSSESIIAVGGINHDPYLNSARIGRLRHIYVQPEYRRTGVGRKLVQQLITSAKPHYEIIRLRVADESGSLFYESIGFSPVRQDTASHIMLL